MRAFTRSLLPILACAPLLITASCYRLTATEGGAPAVGRELVLELSDRGALELAPQLGAQLRSVTGRVNAFGDDGYRVAVTQTNSRGGVETLWRGEEAAIRRDYVLSVAERRLDKRRSWIVAGLSALGVILAGEAFGVDTPFSGLFGARGGGSTQ